MHERERTVKAVSISDSVSSAIWEAFSAQSSFVFLRETHFSLRELNGSLWDGRLISRMMPLAAWCRWCSFQ